MRVDNTELREAFEASGLSASEVARRLEWLRPDDKKVRVRLGLVANKNPHDRGADSYAQTTVDYDEAVALCRAIGCDPHEVGL